MGNQTSIEINGKKYDALTGKLITEAGSQKTQVTQVKHVMNQGVVDGFTRRPSNPKKSTHQLAKHANKNPQKSQTLMRKSVQKPTPAPRKIAAAVQSIKKSSLGQNTGRQTHAKEIHRSPQIQKFGVSAAKSSIVKTQAHLPVKQQPEASHDSHNIPATQSHQSSKSAHVPHKAATEKIIEAALTNAQSHNNVHDHKVKKRSRLAHKLGVSTKTIALSSAVLSGVLLAGFFAVQNVPNLAMRVAATRAGFDATMPGYKPAGFSFKGPINYAAGKVTVSFVSNTDSRAYELTQKSSKWNSDALLSNFVVAENKQYQTYLDRGRTLYIYDGSNATWVDNGIWYQVEGNSDMTTDQLVRIASSI